MKRSGSSIDYLATETKWPKMDVPPVSCLRSRRPRVAQGGRGRDTLTDAEDRSLNGQLSSAASDIKPNGADVKSELVALKNEVYPIDEQKNQYQEISVDAKDTSQSQVATRAFKQSKSPKMLLNEHYAQHQIKSVKNQYTTIQHDKIVKFVSIFSCPLTGERFMSGRLKGIEFVEKDGIVWYANKQSATTAAAARAIDCLIFRHNVQNQSSRDDAPQCLDTPYLKSQGPEIPHCLVEKLPAVKVERSGALAVKSTGIKDNLEEAQSSNGKYSDNSNASLNKSSKISAVDSVEEKKAAASCIARNLSKSPRQLLNEHYAKLHIKIDKSNYTTKKHDKVQVFKFASVFTCPLTRESFAGGRLKNELYSNEDGAIWYANAKLSITSAAARAIDCITFRQFLEQKSQEELPEYNCLDSPYLKHHGPALSACFGGEFASYPIPENNAASKNGGSNEAASTKLESQLEDTNEVEFDRTILTSNPRQELNQYYSELLGHNQLGHLKNYYVVWERLFNKSPRYTCIFVCPITLEAFPSGHLSERNEEAILYESAFWYYKKQLARDAAAAKAVDCFAFRDCYGRDERPMIRCLDAAYVKGNGPSLPILLEGVNLPTATLNVQKQPSSTTKIALNPVQKNVATDGSPTQVLKTWYSAYWRIINTAAFRLAHPKEKMRQSLKDHFSTWTNLQIQAKTTIKLFTSVFVCPWSGERFLSGKLLDKQMQCTEQDFELGVQDSQERVETRKLVWYRSKKDAMNAAAGVALDCYHFRFLNRNLPPVLNTARYCVEPPREYDGRDIIQRLIGVMEVYTDSSRPINFILPWHVVPATEKMPIRYGS